MYNQVLHDHLDGGLRPSTAKELAKQINYEPIFESEDNYLIENIRSFEEILVSDIKKQ